jgi:MerR family regulatory protein
MLDYEAGEMQIGQVSQNTGLSIDTIRFFEKQGLVHPRTIWSIGVDRCRPSERHGVDCTLEHHQFASHSSSSTTVSSAVFAVPT